MVKQSQVEEQIYNSYLSDINIFNNYNSTTYNSILFKLCTNLLIANIHSNDNQNSISNIKIETLEDISNQFVGKLEIQLKKLEKDITDKGTYYFTTK